MFSTKSPNHQDMESKPNFGITDAKQYLGLHISLLEISGMWPARKFQKKWVNILALLCLTISISCQILVLLGEQAYLIASSSDPLEIIAYIGTACLRVEAIAKLIYMFFIRKEVKKLLKSLEACFRLSTRDDLNENECTKSIMSAWSCGAIWMAFAWSGMCTFGGTQWALVPFGINGEVTTTVQDDVDLQLYPSNRTDLQLSSKILPNNNSEVSYHLEKCYIRVLPLRGWFPFNATLSPAYEIVFLIQGIGNICSALAVGVFDQFYFAILLLLCGQFQCLKKSLTNIKIFDKSGVETGAFLTDSQDVLETDDYWVDDNVILNEKPQNLANGDDTGDVLQKNANLLNFPGRQIHKIYLKNKIISEMEEKLKASIRHHQSLISVVREVNAVYSPMIFIQCLKSLLALCLVAFQGTMVNGDVLQLFSLVEYLYLLVVQLFLFCWCASEVTVKSASVQDAAYSSAWPDASSSFNTSLKLMIFNCQVPLQLTGGKFYILTMELFVELLRVSFSYYTVLRQVHENTQME